MAVSLPLPGRFFERSGRLDGRSKYIYIVIDMDLARMFKALGDPTRLRILAAVAQEELTVGEIREVVDSVQSAVSRNLAILRDAGFVAEIGRASCRERV